MATITDASYFQKGILFISNNIDLSARPEGSPSSQSKLDVFVENCERDLLLNALGVTLYDELQVALSDLDNLANAKWKDLVDGTNYTINNKTFRWNGLKGYNKQSLIAFYTYCQYLRNDEISYTTVGHIKSTAENGVISEATPKFIKSWNNFLKMYQSFYKDSARLIQNGFGEFGLDYSFNGNNIQVSLYQYLTDANELDVTAFPDFEFKFYESYNSFGI